MVIIGVVLFIICYLSDKEIFIKIILLLQFEWYMNLDFVFCKCKVKLMNLYFYRKDGFGIYQILWLFLFVVLR